MTEEFGVEQGFTTTASRALLSRVVVGILAAALLAGLLPAPGGSPFEPDMAFAQEADQAGHVPGEPAELAEAPTPAPTEAEPIATEPNPADESTAESTVDASAASETPADLPNSDAESTPPPTETDTVTEPAATPPLVITFDPNAVVTCELPAGDAAIEHDGWLDYACNASVDITTENLAVLDAALDWTMLADAAGDWQVQLAPLPEESEWTPSGHSAAIDLNSPFAHEGGNAAWRAEASIGFRVRIHRPRCDASLRTVDLRASVALTTPGHPEIAIEPEASEREPLRLEPALAPIPEPIAGFDGSITFDPISLTAVDDAVAGGNALVIVTGLDRACGSWQLVLQAKSGDGAATFWLAAINGVPVDTACALDDGCAIDLVNGDAGWPTEAVYSVELLLTISSGVPPGTLTASFDIALIAA